MTLWAMEANEETLGVYLPEEELLRPSHRAGINPIVMRDTFREFGVDEALFQLVAPAGNTVRSDERQQVTDFLLWSWVPIFSDRARAVAIDLGCDSDEFLPCHFESNLGESFFMHVPARSYDVVDVERSTFLMMIPADPPIPFYVKRLVTRNLPEQLPPCFRADIPNHSQVISDLFVTAEFKLAWEQRGFTGGKFRKLA